MLFLEGNAFYEEEISQIPHFYTIWYKLLIPSDYCGVRALRFFVVLKREVSRSLILPYLFYVEVNNHISCFYRDCSVIAGRDINIRFRAIKGRNLSLNHPSSPEELNNYRITELILGSRGLVAVPQHPGNDHHTQKQTELDPTSGANLPGIMNNK